MWEEFNKWMKNHKSWRKHSDGSLLVLFCLWMQRHHPEHCLLEQTGVHSLGVVLSHGAASPSRIIFLPFPSCVEQGQDDNSGWQQRVNFLTKSDILLKC